MHANVVRTAREYGGSRYSRQEKEEGGGEKADGSVGLQGKDKLFRAPYFRIF